MDVLVDAMDQVRERCPGWAYAVLARAMRGGDLAKKDAGPLPALDHVLAAVAAGGVCQVQPTGRVAKADAGAREAQGLGEVRAALRWAFDQAGSDGASIQVGDRTHRLAKAQDPRISRVVPTVGPQRPRVAFVGQAPSAIDAARGEPLTGPDGEVFAERYLAPLGLHKVDVLITHVMPVADEPGVDDAVQFDGFAQAALDRHKPTVTVALGKAAAAALGARADFVLPHPAVFRKGGDNGELTRRLKQIRARMESVATHKADVHIVRKDGEKRIVIGVVLDGYQFDSQSDWVPPAEIETTAHEWMATSRVVGIQHSGPADAVVVESWLWPYPSSEDYRAAMAGEPHKCFASKYGSDIVHSGSWLIGVRVEDDATWEAIQSGAITAYSIGGVGLQSPVSETAMPEVEFIEG
jgi:uracil-DNA glycosylase family 4